MSAILITLCCLLAAGKVTTQSAFAKSNIKNSTDAVLFNGMIFIFSSIIFVKSTFEASYGTIFYAALSGLFSLIYQFTYIQALSIGPVSITVLISNLSTVIPILISATFFKEPLTLIRTVGIILTFTTFFLNVQKQKSVKTSVKWLTLVTLTFCSNAAALLAQKFFTKSPYGNEASAYVSLLYISAAIISLIMYLILKRNEKKSFSYSPKVFGFAALTGLLLGVFQLLNTYAVQVVDGTLYYPVFGGGSTLAMTIIGIIFFKDKLNKRQWYGVATGITAVILMSL